jgi:hypothetical protein
LIATCDATGPVAQLDKPLARSPSACDHLTTIPKDALGLLLEDQEQRLSKAIDAAFDLD